MASCQQGAKLADIAKSARPVKSSDIKHKCIPACDGSCCHIEALLTPWPKTLPEARWLGDLYLESEHGAVSCEFANFTNENIALPAQVKCLVWTFVVDGKKREKLIEIHEWELSCPSPSRSMNSLSAVDVSTAFTLLHNKDKLQCKSVNITGKVSTLSEIIRIKGEPLFLVQLSSDAGKINILVKKAKYLYWQKLLDPEKYYLITGLRPTTLYKGTDQQTKLYVPWDKSQIFNIHAGLQFKVISLKEWLSLHDEKEDIKLDEPSPTPDEGSTTTTMFTYKGIITSVAESGQGIYELDRRIRLFLGYVPAVNQYRHLRLGTEIIVCNAHHKGSPKPPKIRLYCCFASCVKVTQFPKECSFLVNFLYNECELTHLINKFSLSVHEVEGIDSLVLKTKEKFNLESSGGGEDRRLVFKALTKPSDSSENGLFRGKVRNVLREFLDPRHNYCSAFPSNKEKPEPNLWTFPTIDDVRSYCEELGSDYSEVRQSLLSSQMTRKQLNEHVYWTKFEINSEDIGDRWVLLGNLETDGVRGQMSLSDHSASLDCVISTPHDDHSSHTSCMSHTDTDLPPNQPCQCHFILPQHLGRLVRLDCYRLIIERFTLANFPQPQDIGNEYFIEKTHFKLNLLFSMRQVTFLSKYVDWTDLTQPLPCNDNTGKSAQNDPCSERPAKRAKISHNSRCDKTGKGSQTKDKYKTQLLILIHKDNLHVKSRIGNQSSLCFYASVTFLNDPSDYEKQKFEVQNSGRSRGSEHSDPEGKLPVQHTVLVFQNSSVGWYHVLRPGGVYRFVYREDEGSGGRGWAHQSLQRAVEKAKTRSCIGVATTSWFIAISSRATSSGTPLEKLSASEADLVKKVLDDLSRKGQNHSSLMNLENALTHSIQEPVNFRARILCRRFTESGQREPPFQPMEEEVNDRLGVSVPGNLHLCLTLADPDIAIFDARLKIYINLRNLSYPLGLLDGATVDVHKAQLKKSQSGSLYAQLLVSGSLVVSRMPEAIRAGATPDVRYDGMVMSPEEMNSYPFMKFSALYSRPSDRACFLRSVCHIHKVLSIKLWSDCATCGNPHKQGHCTYLPCRSMTLPKVKAKASVLVDDGSTNAYMACIGNTQISTLLDLDDTQWQVLEQAARDHGELQVNMGSTAAYDAQPGALELFLMSLCDSSLVKRSLMICAKYKPNDISLPGWSWRRVEVGKGDSLETRSLPFLQLHALHLEKVEWHQYLFTMINETPH